MRRIEESIFIDRPCTEVFAYLENRDNDGTWMVAVLDSHWLDSAGGPDGSPVRLGRRGRMVMTIRGRRMEIVDEVIAYAPGRRIAHRTVEGPFPLDTACLCDPAGNGCRATVVGEAVRFVQGPFARLIEPFVARGIRRGFRKDLVRLKEILETGEAAT